MCVCVSVPDIHSVCEQWIKGEGGGGRREEGGGEPIQQKPPQRVGKSRKGPRLSSPCSPLPPCSQLATQPPGKVEPPQPGRCCLTHATDKHHHHHHYQATLLQSLLFLALRVLMALIRTRLLLPPFSSKKPPRKRLPNESFIHPPPSSFFLRGVWFKGEEEE